MSVTNIIRRIISSTQRAGMGYRRVFDPVKPTIDKIVDSTAVFVAGNATLSALVYCANKLAVQPSLDWVLGQELLNDLAAHPTLDSFIKGGVYAGIYGYANYKVILPGCRGVLNRTTTPSWSNHLKTLALLSIAGATFFKGGVYYDVKRFHREFWKAENFQECVDVVRTRVFDKYLSGRKIAEIVSLGRLERELSRVMHRKKGFSYTDKVSVAAESLINEEMFDIPEQFVHVVRVGYFEAGYDLKAKNYKAIKEGLIGVFSVMKNRWIYDSYQQKHGKKRIFSDRNGNLFDIAFYIGNKRGGGRRHEFVCVEDKDNQDYFYEYSGKKGWDMYEGGKLNVAVGRMDKRRAQLALEAAIDVFSGKVKDNTNGALYYQNPSLVRDKGNKPRNWEKGGLKRTKIINSHWFYRPQSLRYNWAEKMYDGKR